jgi:predicted metal-binding membrane protein
MDKLQKIILFLLILTSAFAWIISKDQPDMNAIMTFNPTEVLIFTASWTVGMIAMMFPAISPMVLLYNRLVKHDGNNVRGNLYGQKENFPSSSFILDENENNVGKRSFFIHYSFKMILFVVCYLIVWTLTGIMLLFTSSVIMNIFIVKESDIKQLDVIYGILLIISGAYQFSPLKTKCIGYCESPFSFFMRRWKSGTSGAVKMGTFHGLYCLGCCWPYFLLMISLGWMNLLWMALFSLTIFIEKIWSRGLLVARITGIGLMILGIVAITLAPNAHSLLGVGDIDEENHSSKSMDMKGMMNIGKNMTSDNKPHNNFTNNNDNNLTKVTLVLTSTLKY